MKDIFCPGCRHHLNAATAVADNNLQPTAGDLSVCLYCGAGLVYLAGGDVRLMTDGELQKLNDEERFLFAGAQSVGVIYRAKFGKGEKA